MLEIFVIAYCLYFAFSTYTSFMQIGFVKDAKKLKPIILDSKKYEEASNYSIEKEKIEDRKEFETDYNSFKDETEEVEKDAIIDTVANKLYIQTSEDKVCITNLLTGEYVENENGNIERIEERLYFKSTLDEVYEQLTKK